jgi:DNA-directed RNA polymerase subunit L
MVHTNEKYETDSFVKLPTSNILYDDQVLACFYNDIDHPMVHIFGRHFITTAKLFAQYGMTVLTYYVKDNKIHLLVVPRDKVKIFKE